MYYKYKHHPGRDAIIAGMAISTDPAQKPSLRAKLNSKTLCERTFSFGVALPLSAALCLATAFVLTGASIKNAALALNKDEVSIKAKGESATKQLTRFPDLQPLPTRRRELIFPAGESAGGIAIFDKPMYAYRQQEAKSFKAQGRVTVQENKWCIFYPNHNFYANPHMLDKLPPDAFDGIEVRFASMTNEEEGLSNKALPYLTRFKSIRVVDADKSEMKDQAVVALKDLPNLEILMLFANELDGSFLKSMTGLKKLKMLAMNNNGLDTRNLKYLTNVPSVATLDVGHMRLRPVDAEPVFKMPNLTSLSISSNPDIDDTVVPKMMAMKTLKWVDLRRTHISSAAIKKMTKERPDMHLILSLSSKDQEEQERQLQEKLAKTSNKAVKEKLKARAEASKKSDEEIETIFGPMSRGRGL